MKTRVELKEELLKVIPKGEERKYLAEAESKLNTLQSQLQQLQAKRATIRRGITIRERKLRDWKSKIPRATDIPSVSAVKNAVQALPLVKCLAVGHVSNDVSYISISKRFAPALTGLDGFEKVWLILQALNDKDGDTHCEEAISSSQPCQQEKSACHDSNVNFVLVDVVSSDARSGAVHIGNLSITFANAMVLDIKPYLPYCESWPNHSAKGAGPTLE